ncbi:hypothetical protein FHS18_003916 [Paenibacillus phyllosphaerae]|uniref:Lipoprotein n=1 Tax=Paenibacillus phyllosphaerae TaxID=274593 RepID=A0A7W5B007_9BACL|nr:hypothetical protein [Paenibacillus phyllosphaerae]MBB3111848.1 hypothetical protein [Paenibacillus phyllosphaerae]
MKGYIKAVWILAALSMSVIGCTNAAEPLSNPTQTEDNADIGTDVQEQGSGWNRILTAQEAVNRVKKMLGKQLQLPLWLSDAELIDDKYKVTLFQEITSGNTRKINDFYVNRYTSDIYYDNGNGKLKKVTSAQLTDGAFPYRNDPEPAAGTGQTTEHERMEEQNSDYLIVPGQSIGKIALGMTQGEVLAILGRPTETGNDELIYRSARNYIRIAMESGIVKQVEFSSPAFATAEGIDLGNYGDSADAFDVKQYWRNYMQLRYDLAEGGLTFIRFNAGMPADNGEYEQYVRGYLYAGKKMFNDPIPDAVWEPRA